MKKVLKISLFSLLSIVLLALALSYISYSGYQAKDASIEIDSLNLLYFHESYEDCRTAFTENAITLSLIYDSVETGRFFVPSKIDDDLSVDWCYVPAQKKKEKLLILTSGLHGIEGYTGSAIQNMFIEKILKDHPLKNIGVLFIHGLNPYGFKYRRKVTENNVDLNRNCVINLEDYNSKNEGYGKLTELLMPEEEVSMSTLKNQFFYLVAINKIIKESMSVLRQAALQGQYDYEKGIYYGGKNREPQIEMIKPLLADKMNAYRVALNIDLHTAYGERCKLHLFQNPIDDHKVKTSLETIFEGTKIDWGSGEDFYIINGEFTAWANSLAPNTLGISTLFEFGTMNSQKTFGSLKSIQTMITENQGVHHGYKNKKQEAKIKHNFSEMYYPTSPVWRSKVISDSYNQMVSMMKNFQDF